MKKISRLVLIDPPLADEPARCFRERSLRPRLWTNVGLALLVGVFAFGISVEFAPHVMATEPSAKEPSTANKRTPEQMPLLERQKWAVAMLQRLDRANDVILDPPYVVSQRERFEELAKPLLYGTSQEEIHQTVQTLRDEVEKSERIAIEHLDRQFRQLLAEKFPTATEKTLRDPWFNTWQATVQAWQKSDTQADRLYLLFDWLQNSCAALEAGNYASVIPVPVFTDQVAEAKKETPTTPPTSATAPIETREPAETPKSEEPTERVAAKPKRPATPDDFELLQKQPTTTEKAPPSSTTPALPADPRAAPPEIPPGLSIDRSGDQTLPPRYVTRKPTTSPEPSPQEPPPGTTPETPPQTPSSRPPLDINLPELAAQVSGNNLALSRLEAKLTASGSWDAKRLDPLVMQLKQIVLRLGDARMVYRLLAPEQQRQIKTIGDPAAAIKLLRSKIRAQRVATLESRGSSASLTKEQRVELEQLDMLSDELNSIDSTETK